MTLIIMLFLYYGFVCCLIFWWARLARNWKSASTKWAYVSWFFVIVNLVVGTIRFESRSLSALVTEGLTWQNKIQVGITIVAAGWALLLLITKRIRLQDMIYGSGFWISVLVFLYALSSFWSIWPMFTFFRTLELGSYWVIIKHLFSQEYWKKEVHKLLLIAFGIVWVASLFFPEPGMITGNSFVAAIRWNTASLISAALIIYLVFTLMQKQSILGWLELSAAAISLLIFGSFVSFIALMGGLITLYVFSSRKNLRFSLLFIFTSGIFFLAILSLFFGSDNYPIFGLEQLSKFYGKTSIDLTSWTGRLPYWTSTWEIAKNEPIGLGFAAAERFIALDPDFLGPELGHAHNGYISAWLGAGWPGATVLLTLFAAVGMNTKYLAPEKGALVLSFLILLGINNLTNNAVGGQLKATFMLMMALTCTPIVSNKLSASVNFAID